ncbi:MAG: hypothetical protein HUJ22_01290 [Gracilimonas sp.]|uniref:hypothetical protein n=1 Tax=Gracilimonas sp. TaxID=1974203 RepID=UPI0019B80A84|nr:hypothetical protein [Gracilimonas sp.]MBD3615176.1 hypothetical protein [Gracilimonas sp.]
MDLPKARLWRNDSRLLGNGRFLVPRISLKGFSSREEIKRRVGGAMGNIAFNDLHFPNDFDSALHQEVVSLAPTPLIPKKSGQEQLTDLSPTRGDFPYSSSVNEFPAIYKDVNDVNLKVLGRY